MSAHAVATLYDQLEEGGHVAPGVDRDTVTRVIAAALAGEVGAWALGDCRTCRWLMDAWGPTGEITYCSCGNRDAGLGLSWRIEGGAVPVCRLYEQREEAPVCQQCRGRREVQMARMPEVSLEPPIATVDLEYFTAPCPTCEPRAHEEAMRGYRLGDCGRLGCRGVSRQLNHSYCRRCRAAIQEASDA